MKNLLFKTAAIMVFTILATSSMAQAPAQLIANGTYRATYSNVTASNQVNAAIMQGILSNDTIAASQTVQTTVEQALQNLFSPASLPTTFIVNGSSLMLVLPDSTTVLSSIQQEDGHPQIGFPNISGIVYLQCSIESSGTGYTIHFANGLTASLSPIQ